MTENYEDIERRMQPGAWDPAGFLLPGQSLRDCLAADARTCARLGIEPGTLGARLLDLLATGRDSEPGSSGSRGGRKVTIMRQRGMITCPWAPDEYETCPAGPGGRPTANRFRIVVDGVALDGFELSAHLIAAHGFFGSAGTRYRIEPQDALTATDPSR